MPKIYEIDIIYRHHGIQVEANSDDEAVEKACELAWQLDADETITSIRKAYDPDATPSYNVGDHFTGPGGELIIHGIYKHVVFYAEVNDPSLEGTMMDRQAFEDAIRAGEITNQRAETVLEQAMRLIDNFCCLEFKAHADFSNLARIGVAHTTIEDDELPIQVYADLVNFKVDRLIQDVLVETRQYQDLEEMIDEELGYLDFDELCSFSDEEIETFKQASKLLAPMSMDTHGLSVSGVYGTWHTVDHIQIEGQTFWMMKQDGKEDGSPIIVDSNGMLCIRNAEEGFNARNLHLLKLEASPVKNMPDPSLSIRSMKHYGYFFGGMLPVSKDVAQKLYAKNLCTYRLYEDDTEGMVNELEEIEEHAAAGGIFGIEKADWALYLTAQKKE